MPIFYQEDINRQTRIGIWKIEEGEDFFLQKVPLSQQVVHPHKRLQHLAGRYLLQYLFPQFPYSEIVIADTRKPYLPQAQFHFSISHCGNYAAAIVSSSQRVGADIELYSPKTELVKYKFLNEAELALVDNQEPAINISPVVEHPQTPTGNQQLFTLFWCCKEVVYKWWGLGSIDFRKHILIQQFNAEEQQINVVFTKQLAQLVIRYTFFEELCLAWTAG